MAKNVENCSILIVFIASVLLSSQLFQYYAHSEILGCSDNFGGEHFYRHNNLSSPICQRWTAKSNSSKRKETYLATINTLAWHRALYQNLLVSQTYYL